MKTVPVLLKTLLILSVSGCGVLDSLILRPSPNIRLTPDKFGFKASTLKLPMPDGGEISIWHVQAAGERKGTLVIIPGNDANKSRYTAALPIFAETGWDVILMDYPGFGESTGAASFEGVMASARVVMEHALAQDDVVVGYGISLGTPVLARVAADLDLSACVFESTINIWNEPSLFLAAHGLPSPLAAVGDAIAAIGTSPDWEIKHWITLVTEPKLFLHSPDDSVTPFAGAWEVFQLAPQPKHLFATQGEHATQVFLDPVLCRNVVNGWLDGVLNRDPALADQFHQILQDETQAARAQLGL